MTQPVLSECIHGLLAVCCSLCAKPADRELALTDAAIAEQRTHVLKTDLAAALVERSAIRDVAYLHRERTIPVHRPSPTSLPGIPDSFHDQVTELCERTSQPTTYSVWETTDGEKVLVPKTWRAVEESLIVQLEHAADRGATEQSGGSFGSRPAAHLESLDCLTDIANGVAEWLEHVEADATGPVAGLLKLRSVANRLHRCDRHRGNDDCCDRHNLERDVHHWWVQARIITGWDSPAFKPWNTCPVCDTKGSLRVRVNPDSGMCRECRATWGPDTIGVLAEHIRTENEEGEAS